MATDAEAGTMMHRAKHCGRPAQGTWEAASASCRNEFETGSGPLQWRGESWEA